MYVVKVALREYVPLKQGLRHLPHVIRNGYKVEDLLENFATRQGKNRSNDIHFRPGEINSRNGKYND